MPETRPLPGTFPVLIALRFLFFGLLMGLTGRLAEYYRTVTDFSP